MELLIESLLQKMERLDGFCVAVLGCEIGSLVGLFDGVAVITGPQIADLGL